MRSAAFGLRRAEASGQALIEPLHDRGKMTAVNISSDGPKIVGGFEEALRA